MSRKIQNAIVASAIALVASVGAAEAATTVKFWHSFNESNGETLDKIVAGFEAANPDIDIEAEYVGNYNDIVAKLQAAIPARRAPDRSEEHMSELQSLMRISYAVFCLKKKN